MGHSFGGISVLGAASDCIPAKAVIALDPWFYPRNKDRIGSADHQKSLIIMTEYFPKAVKKEKNSGYMDTNDQIEKYS